MRKGFERTSSGRPEYSPVISLQPGRLYTPHHDSEVGWLAHQHMGSHGGIEYPFLLHRRDVRVRGTGILQPAPIGAGEFFSTTLRTPCSISRNASSRVSHFIRGRRLLGRNRRWRKRDILAIDRPQEHGNNDSISFFRPLERPRHFNTHAVTGQEEIDADQEQDDVGSLEVFIDRFFPAFARLDVAVVPTFDQLVQRSQVFPELALETGVLVRIRAKIRTLPLTACSCSLRPAS
jgi:hypothetical protein